MSEHQSLWSRRAVAFWQDGHTITAIALLLDRGVAEIADELCARAGCRPEDLQRPTHRTGASWAPIAGAATHHTLPDIVEAALLQGGRAADMVLRYAGGQALDQIGSQWGLTRERVRQVVSSQTPWHIGALRAARTAFRESEQATAAAALLAWSHANPGRACADAAAELDLPEAQVRALLGRRRRLHENITPHTGARRRSDEDLLADLQRWHATTGGGSAQRYSEWAAAEGVPGHQTAMNRFGGWNAALQRAGIGDQPSRARERRHSEEDLWAALIDGVRAGHGHGRRSRALALRDAGSPLLRPDPRASRYAVVCATRRRSAAPAGQLRGGPGVGGGGAAPPPLGRFRSRSRPARGHARGSRRFGRRPDDRALQRVGHRVGHRQRISDRPDAAPAFGRDMVGVGDAGRRTFHGETALGLRRGHPQPVAGFPRRSSRRHDRGLQGLAGHPIGPLGGHHRRASRRMAPGQAARPERMSDRIAEAALLNRAATQLALVVDEFAVAGMAADDPFVWASMHHKGWHALHDLLVAGATRCDVVEEVDLPTRLAQTTDAHPAEPVASRLERAYALITAHPRLLDDATLAEAGLSVREMFVALAEVRT